MAPSSLSLTFTYSISVLSHQIHNMSAAVIIDRELPSLNKTVTLGAAAILQSSNGPYILFAAVVIAIIAFISRLLSFPLDPHEPPPLKPVIPLIGHIINIIRQETTFGTNLAYVTYPTLPLTLAYAT